jgi:hypothetical protein
LGQGSWNRTAGTGQPEQYSRDRTARTLKPEQENQDRKVKEKRLDSTARIGNRGSRPEHDSKDGTPKTGQPKLNNRGS